MALINMHNIDSFKNRQWPNPYNLKDSDKKGHCMNMSLEIMTLVMYEQESQTGYCSLTEIQENNIGKLFFFEYTRDGYDFWLKMSIGDYKEFYKRYTPSKLKNLISNGTCK